MENLRLSRQVILLVLTFLAAVGTAEVSHALIIQNLTQGTTVFNSHGFEFDTVGGAPTTDSWSNGLVSHDFVTTGGTPGAFEGNNYLSTTRDFVTAGNPRAFLGSAQTTPGDVIHAEWMMYVNDPPLSDLGFFFANPAGTNIGQVRIGGQGLTTLQDSWSGAITPNVYQPNGWQKWELDYTIGAANYSVTVNGGTPVTGIVPGGAANSTGFGHLSFFHNGQQTYYLDATPPPPLGPYEPQPQQTLKKMIQIDYNLGPRIPEGVQDSGIGIANNTLISVGGFNNGSGPGGREFHNDTYALDLSNPSATWQTLPAYPGQNVPTNVDGPGVAGLISSSTVVNDELYVWGGFNYTNPATYAEGYKLSKSTGSWQWSAMPSLPDPRLSTGIVAVGDKIYAVGGADYDLTQFYTQNNRNGTLPDFGAKTYVLDTNNPGAGWQEVAEMPGTPRWVHSTSVVGDKIYVIGGATGSNDDGLGNFATHTVVDNWVYDTNLDEWSRIRDLPVASGNFPGNVVVDDRFILLIGGYPYGIVENPDGSVSPSYGTPTQVSATSLYADVWVYDTQTNLFGTSDLLPLNNNLPATVYKDGVLHMIGGETEGTTVLGEFFAHHPDLYLRGNVTVLVLDGDLNGDGFVGIADLNIVLGNWNQNVPPGDPLADPSGDGFVGIADLNIVLGNWNAGTPPGSSTVPEPAGLLLMAVCSASMLRRTT